MRRTGLTDHDDITKHNSTQEFAELLDYINTLAQHKLGYPVSLLTYLGVIDNSALGILPGTLANVLLNNVGDPFKDSETSLMEVKHHEREVIAILERYYGMAKGEARGYVTSGGTEGNFAGLWWSKRYLINMAIDSLIRTDDCIKRQIKEEQDLEKSLTKISLTDLQRRLDVLQKIVQLKNEIERNRANVQQLLAPTVFYSKENTHYSIGKIAEILHLNIRGIASNPDGSLDLKDFQKELLLNLNAYPMSPIIVIANIGTTITGAIDDVPGIKKILDNSHPKPRYTIHLDGALTGFVMPILKPFGPVTNYFKELGVNTLAVSAHKFPGLSQPSGIILAQIDFFKKAFEKSERNIDYVGNILDVTITGSRSGLNVLMFYHALCTLGLDVDNSKLSKMCQDIKSNADYLYEQLVQIYGSERVWHPHHFNVIFPRPSLAMAKKYQLMLTGERATVCVLTNVTRELINQFVTDLKADVKETTMTINQTDYTIVPLTEEYAKSTIQLFTKAFCQSEPITKHIGIQYADYEPFASEVVYKAAKEGLSKVAIDKQNHVIACCIAEDMADPFMPKASHYPKLKPVLALIEELSKPFLEDRKFVKGKVVHVWIAVVDDAYRGKKISTEIDLATIENAARKGFDFAYAEFTNEISERVTSQFSLLKRCHRINFSDFIFAGNKPFKGLKGHASSYVATIRPGVKLENITKCYTTEENF